MVASLQLMYVIIKKLTMDGKEEEMGSRIQTPLRDLMNEYEKKILSIYTPCIFEPLEEIVHALAVVHTELLLIHPFREGNGRLSRLLIALMALQAGLPLLDFSNIHGRKREEYFEAARTGMRRDYAPMERIFTSVVSRTLRISGRPNSS